MLIAGNSYALKPKKEYIYKPDKIGMNYNEIPLSTPDNFTINTWTMHPDKDADNKTVMIFAYADGMNMSYWIDQAAYFVKEGFTVVTFDYRGFGESSPFAIDTNQLYYTEYATDLETVIKYARDNNKGYKIGIRGLSMGTIIGTIASSKVKVDYFIGDSFVCDPVLIKQRFATENVTITLPADVKNYTTILKANTTHLLVFSGTEDRVTSVDDSKAMIAGHNERKLITYKGGHLEGIYVLTGKSAGSEYIQDIKDFLKKH